MKLVTMHLFPFIRMINKLDIKHEIKELFSNKLDLSGKSEEEKKQLLEARGLDFVFVFVEKLPNAEKEVFEFLALYSGKSIEEIKAAELTETMELIKALFQDEAFTAFFRQAVK